VDEEEEVMSLALEDVEDPVDEVEGNEDGEVGRVSVKMSWRGPQVEKELGEDEAEEEHYR
jgi:hypothetical protein